MGKDKAPKDLQNATIANLRAQGKSTREIGKVVHLSHQTVANKLKDSDVKENVINILKYFATFSEEVGRKFMGLVLSDDPAIALKAIESYFKSMGIVGTQTPPIYIQTINQIRQVIAMAPHLQDILTKHSGDAIIDVEIIQDTPLITSNNSTLDEERT